MLSYVLPTRGRPHVLACTLDRLARLQHLPGEAEVVIVDNASTPAAVAPRFLSNGIPVRLIRLSENRSAAARNVGVEHAAGEWIVMLDDDSSPLDADGLLSSLQDAAPDVAAVQAEIYLPSPGQLLDPSREIRRTELTLRESGGLPEVIIGCGCAIRREAFNQVGGYDPSFDYYAEEYDLSAKLLLAGHRVTLDRRFGVLHEKSSERRSFGRIIRRLVRNNAWVNRRYAPASEMQHEHEHLITRYWAIARKEHSLLGYLHGYSELLVTLAEQPRTPMPTEIWDRFTGLAAARDALMHENATRPLGRVALINEGKNAHLVRRALQDMYIDFAPSRSDADTLVIATLSPGPMLSAIEAAVTAHAGRRVIAPWRTAMQGQSTDRDATHAVSLIETRLAAAHAA